MNRVEVQLYTLSKCTRKHFGRILFVCALLMITAPHARAAAALVNLTETWTPHGRDIANPSAITYVPSAEGNSGSFFVADVHYAADESFVSSRAVALGADLEPRDTGFDLGDLTRDPSGLAYHPTRKTFFVTDDDEVELYEIGLDGRHIQTIDLSDLGSRDPEGIACDPTHGILFIADGRAQRILEITPDGDLQRSFSVAGIPGFREAEGITYDPRNGHLYVTTGKSAVLFELTRGGNVVAAFDLDVLGAQRPRGVTLAPSTDPSDAPDDLHFFVVDNAAKKQPQGRLLEIKLAQRPSAAFHVTSLVGDVDGFGFSGLEPDFAAGDLDHNGLLERGEQLPNSILGASTLASARNRPTDSMLVTREDMPIVIDHDFALGTEHPATPTWARLTLVVGDARTRAGTRNVVRVDGRRVGEVIGTVRKELKAGAIATTVIQLPPAVLDELSDGSARIEIAREPGTGSDDIMIDYSRLEVAVAR